MELLIILGIYTFGYFMGRLDQRKTNQRKYGKTKV